MAGSLANAKKRRHLSAEVQTAVEARALVEYHIAIAAGRANVRLNPNGQGIMWDEKGITPTQAERTASVNWLSDRGHGLPVQAHVLHAQITSASADDVPRLPESSPMIVWAIRDALQAIASRTLPAPATPAGVDPASVIDVPSAPAVASVIDVPAATNAPAGELALERESSSPAAD